ncbi:MAG: hypothetical protein KTR20_13630 [Cellvibrionaceae bacterium]|nr:hypothetical protein [Cellvibrionaceae bacterium]
MRVSVTCCQYAGFTLVELLGFIVVVSVSFVGVFTLYQQVLSAASAPSVHSQLLHVTQSQLDRILTRKFDENTPAGGIPSCAHLGSCAGIGLDAGESFANLASLDDIDDFNYYTDTPAPGYELQVRVSYAGNVFLLPRTEVKYIWVQTRGPNDQVLQLSAYRTNF